MLKKGLFLAMAALLCMSCTALAADGEYSESVTLMFASDGGSFIRPVTQPYGTVLNLDEYVPVKEGYVFEGWYSDPRTKENRVTAVTFAENDVVYARWSGNGITTYEAPQPRASNAEILQYGSYTDEKTGAPVTALWMEQNERLKELMEQYNQKFNR